MACREPREKQDLSVNAKVHQQAVTLAEVFSLEELQTIQARLNAAAEREQQAKPEETSSGKLLSAPAEFQCAESARNEPAADENVHPEVISHTKAPRSWRE